jgi:1-acyl-sn-glycerol-3-phosphate acyltransferase
MAEEANPAPEDKALAAPCHPLRLGFYLLMRAFTLVFMGVNIRHRERLPVQGPAIIVANHNSHLDTMVLVNLFPLKLLPQITPVAAADYFLTNRLLAWFALRVIGILPLKRGHIRKHDDPLAGCTQALEAGKILILFPEGTRGDPEKLSQFKKGVAALAERFPQVPVIPIYLHGLGKALPKGEAVFVPFFCDGFVGEAMPTCTNRNEWMGQLVQSFEALAAEGNFRPWE